MNEQENIEVKQTSRLDEWIFLYGPPGSGKSSVGRALSEALRLPFVDADLEIERAEGMSIPEIFACQGEGGFRRIEKDTLRRMLTGKPGVLALGGGALLDDANRSLVSGCGTVVCLSASLETLKGRLKYAAPNRPLLAGDLDSRLAGLLESRREHYASFPRQLRNEGIPLEQAAWQSQVLLGRFHVTGMGAGYDSCVLSGGLDELGGAIQLRGLRGPVALVSDENVGPLYGERVKRSLQAAGLECRLVTIRAGEQHKNMATVQQLWEGFLQAGLERGSTVMALGGGVTNDLAGFAAATFLRGVRWVTVPTSLLAMVDASLGGKTGADLPQGKNLVGAFYPPAFFLADPQALDTLPEREKRCGMAEVVKGAVAADRGLLEICSQGWGALEGHWSEIVPRAMAVKVHFIQLDPYEKGPRAALNLGHTIGHALERVSDYRISHGEAVSIGTAAEALLAERIGLAQAGLAEVIASVLENLGLPTRIPSGLGWEAIVAAMQVDKKRQAGSLYFALPAAVGDVRAGVAVSREDLLSFGRCL